MLTYIIFAKSKLVLCQFFDEQSQLNWKVKEVQIWCFSAYPFHWGVLEVFWWVSLSLSLNYKHIKLYCITVHSQWFFNIEEFEKWSNIWVKTQTTIWKDITFSMNGEFLRLCVVGEAAKSFKGHFVTSGLYVINGLSTNFSV